MQKRTVVELNLESGWPTVEEAIKILTNSLITYKKSGCLAVIVIHGYGSSGLGGGIKAAVRKQLGERSFAGLVRSFVGGEDWPLKKKQFISVCSSLEKHDFSIANNAGVTIVLLKR